MDDRLINAIEAAEESCYGATNDQLSSDRAKAIDYYLGRPMGNEIDGRSQIVSRDVADTIEWIKPSLLRIFARGDNIIKFDPRGPEDEPAAKQETDYINYVVTQKNSWFMLCHEWFSDALLTKNAYALAYWDKKKDTTTERYEGLTDEQLTMLVQDGAEIIAHEMMQDAMGQSLHVVQARQTREYGCVQIEVLPPERCLVAESTRGMSLQTADFFEYWDHKTISELRSQGFDVPDDIEEDAGESDTVEDNARDMFSERSIDERRVSMDPAMRRVRVRMCWIRHDYDGDGLSEIRHVVLVGKTILHNQDVSCVPVACIVPVPMPHRHPGLSIFDLVKDIQEIKTAITRAIVDNTYLQNNGRHAISDKVNMDDMLTSRPGGIVRVNGFPGQEITPLVHPFMAPQALQVNEYFDSVRENRTGTNRYFTGVDQNALNKTASGIAQLTSAASQRVEMIALVFAEGGIRELFGIVHELTLKYATQAEHVRLSGNWVTIDPRQWKKRTDMSISVGLGAGNKEQVAAGLMNILMAQKEALALGVTEPRKIYNALAELTKAYGFSTPEKFWTEPPPGPLPPPPPDPKMEIEKQKLQLQAQVEAGKFAVDKEKVAVEREKLQVDRASKLADIEVKRESTQAQLIHAKEIKQHELSHDQQRHAREIEARGQPKVVIDAQGKMDQASEQVMQMAEAAKQMGESNMQVMQAVTHAIQMLSEAMSAERELVRDPKTGKSIGTRIKRPTVQ